MKHRGYLKLVGKGGERTKIKDITIDTLSDEQGNLLVATNALKVVSYLPNEISHHFPT